MNNYIIEDKRTNCLSLLHCTTVEKYLEKIEKAYKKSGGIKGQRTPLKTKTAQTIRERMINDIISGAVLPPIVIGAVISKDEYDTIKYISDDATLEEKINILDINNISIIDGMQRTTALSEALEKNDVVKDSRMRVEYWFATEMNSLIYRMLVLNTGQVPWDIKRQLDTIYDPIINELSTDIVGLDIRLLDQSGKRTQPGQYKSSKLIEYFLCYTSRKVDVDLKEKISEDFARMDAVNATADNNLLKDFKEVIRDLVELDAIFSIAKPDNPNSEYRFKLGKDIFTSAPAGVGFVTSVAVFIYGPPGFELQPHDIEMNKAEYRNLMNSIKNRMRDLNSEEMENFLDLPLLNEKLSLKTGKVGEFERDFFFKSFTAFIRFADKITSMQPCWHAK